MKSLNTQLIRIPEEESSENEEETISEERMTENFLQMMQYESYRCEKKFLVHRVSKNKSTSGHWVSKNGIISNMQRKLSKKPERKDRPPTKGKWKHWPLVNGRQSKRANAQSSESKQLATKSHVPRKAFRGSRT